MANKLKTYSNLMLHLFSSINVPLWSDGAGCTATSSTLSDNTVKSKKYICMCVCIYIYLYVSLIRVYFVESFSYSKNQIIRYLFLFFFFFNVFFPLHNIHRKNVIVFGATNATEKNDNFDN